MDGSYHDIAAGRRTAVRLRELARGKPCSLRIPGVCNRNPETTVLAHMNTEWKGVALKSPDICAVRACSDCHEYVGDMVTPEKRLLGLEGLLRTLKAYVEEGIIKEELTNEK